MQPPDRQPATSEVSAVLRAANARPANATDATDATDAVDATRGFPWRVGVLVVGDALSFMIFAAAGLRQHSEATGALAQVALTAWPFALGWFAVAPWLGAFRERLTTGALAMFKRTELAWLCAYPAALLARWAFGPDHKMVLSFAVVILVSNALFLGLWRTAFAWLSERLAR